MILYYDLQCTRLYHTSSAHLSLSLSAETNPARSCPVSVNAEMALLVGQLCKSAVANLADVWFLACVNALMCNQVAPLLKTFAAERARVQLGRLGQVTLLRVLLRGFQCHVQDLGLWHPRTFERWLGKLLPKRLRFTKRKQPHQSSRRTKQLGRTGRAPKRRLALCSSAILRRITSFSLGGGTAIG